ncbi:MAG: PQQ-dependent sugar dehydrogenase [Chitinophagaceae bacterium]|nr:PQQ-dependent sugar dehydrogenase [Chitinophagaceae bacterium]
MKINLVKRARDFKFIISTPSLLLLSVLTIFSGCKKIDNLFKNQEIDTKLFTDNLVSPLGLVTVPDHSKRLAIIDQIGKVWFTDENGTKSELPLIDVTSKMIALNPNGDERGLLGLAFHPEYKSNRRFYIYYQLPPRAGGPQQGVLWNNLSRISEFKTLTSNPNMADMNSEKIILEWDDPQGNHNGGTIAFGPDHYLYIAIGDGGAANDVAPGHVEDWYPVNAGGNAQNIEANLFGKILRIDINRGSPYGIPEDNPLVNKTGRDEIYAYGFRNPYRFSFDMGGSHELYAGDAGQVLYEEVSVVKKGGNYGWNVKEATHCFNAASNRVELGSCPSVDIFGVPLTDPVIEINHWQNPRGGKATTVIGGNVYRGHDIRALNGKYVFGTFSQAPTTPNGELYMANPAGSGLWPIEEISLKSHPDDIGYYLKGFGQDLQGEIYLAVSSVAGPREMTGKILKLVVAESEKKGK